MLNVSRVEIVISSHRSDSEGSLTENEKRVIFMRSDKIHELKRRDKGIIGDLLREEGE